MRVILHRTNMQIFRLQKHDPSTKTNHQTNVTFHLLENPCHSIEFDQSEI